jgi:hypothetical protein
MFPFYNDFLDGQESQMPGRVLPRASRVLSGNNGVTQDVAAGSALGGGYEQQMGRLLTQSTEAMDRYRQMRDRPVDYTQLQELAKQRGIEGEDAMLNALAAQFAGPQYQGLQGALLKRSMEARDPIKTARGMITAEGFTADPDALRADEIQRAGEDARFYDQQYGRVVDAAERAERAREVARDRRERAEWQRSHADALLDLRRRNASGGGGGDIGAGTATQIGSGSNNEPIFRQRSGLLFTYDAQGQPVRYTGPVLPKASTSQPTEDERKAAAWFVQADNARQNMAAIIRDNPSASLPTLAERAAGLIPLIGEDIANSRRPEARQMFVQAAGSMAEALLRASTGAGVNESEQRQKIAELVPQLGDKPGTIKQKISAYEVYMNALRARAGRALPAGAGANPGGSAQQQGDDGVIDATPRPERR